MCFARTDHMGILDASPFNLWRKIAWSFSLIEARFDRGICNN
ncbi:hypothetical protein SynA1825c_01333 [Synechococcus sp. A18-25c]|nr:hypothetical protein SynA1825c_01333 [Synechococcus sp. A18-25c]